MALKIYTEDEDGNVVGESSGEEYVDYADVQAEVNEKMKGRLSFGDWLRSVIAYFAGAFGFYYGVIELINGGSLKYALKFFGLTAVAICWYFINRKKLRRQ